jgi:hypothetical protein
MTRYVGENNPFLKTYRAVDTFIVRGKVEQIPKSFEYCTYSMATLLASTVLKHRDDLHRLTSTISIWNTCNF